MNMDKLIYIEWIDAVGASGWFSEKGLEEWIKIEDFALVKEVGWIFDETKKYICFYGRLSMDSDNKRQLGAVHKIPKTWVRKRIELTEKKATHNKIRK